MAGGAAGQALTIDLLNDLDIASDLRKLIAEGKEAAFHVGQAIAQFPEQAVSNAIGKSAPLQLSGSPNWIAGPVSFSLIAGAKCVVRIDRRGAAIPVALKIADPDPSHTTDVQLAPQSRTYVNIELDVNITGKIAGTGTAYGLAITAKACGSETVTLSFSQPVPPMDTIADALKKAFAAIVFPTSPDCMTRMAVGSSVKMNVNGTLNWEVDADYGLGDYEISGQSIAEVEAGIAKLAGAGLNVTPPGISMKVGAVATAKYAHTDGFGIIITKDTNTSAQLYLVRSSGDELDASLGLSAGVTVCNVSASVDPSKLQAVVQSVTKNTSVAAKVAPLAASGGNQLLTAAAKKLEGWISDANATAGLSATLSRQKNRAALYSFNVDLTHTGFTQSWKQLITSSLADLRTIEGFTMRGGSGVTDHLEESSTLKFNFFNFCKLTAQKDYFDDCTVELADDGTIRFLYDTGVEEIVSKNISRDKVRVHFTGTATPNAAQGLKTEIDLMLEIDEKRDAKGAAQIAGILDFLTGAAPSLKDAASAVKAYAATNPGTLGFRAILKPSAYRRLAFSPYAGDKPPADQSADAGNFDVLRDCTAAVFGLEWLAGVTYTMWTDYSNVSRGASGTVGDRKALFAYKAPDGFWAKYNLEPVRASTVKDFFVASAAGMNFFEDLAALGGLISASAITTKDQWDAVRQHTARMIKSDMDVDYSKPVSAAILAQASHSGASMTVDVATANDKSTCTVTLTLA
jgi:hypothetical protein